MWRQIIPAVRVTLFFTMLTGVIYPGVITGLCQLLFPRQANGSMVEANGRIVGSALIGQNFTKPEYFQPRPSAAGYDASASAASNYGPTNRNLIERVRSSAEEFRKENPDYQGPIPADLLTASASGLDPDISLASAETQVARIAQARGISNDQVLNLIHDHAKGRVLGFLGEPRVNVLELNLSLDRQFPVR